MQMFDHDKINFEVEQFKIEGIPSNIGVGLRRTDEPYRVMGISKKRYFPVQYMDIVTKIEGALIEASQDSEIDLDLSQTEFNTNVIDHGKKLELTARFHGQQKYLDGSRGWLSKGENGSLVTPELVLRTSHDGSWATNGMMGVWRSKCWNTLVAGDKLAHIYGRHTKNFNVLDFIPKLKEATKYISGDGMKEMKRWYNTPVKREVVETLFQNTLAKKIDNVSRTKEYNKIRLSNLMKIFDEENRHLIGRGRYEGYAQRNEGTIWTAYQAATYWSSHPSLMTNKSGGILYEGKSTPVESRLKVKNRENDVLNMMKSSYWTALPNIPSKELVAA